MIRDRLNFWLQERIATASMIFGVCRRCMAFSAAVTVVGALLLWLALAEEVVALTLVTAFILAYGATLSLVHAVFFIARRSRQEKTEGPD